MKLPEGVHVMSEPPQMLARQLKDHTRTVPVAKWKLLGHHSLVSSLPASVPTRPEGSFFNLLIFQSDEKNEKNEKD